MRAPGGCPWSFRYRAGPPGRPRRSRRARSPARALPPAPAARRDRTVRLAGARAGVTQSTCLAPPGPRAAPPTGVWSRAPLAVAVASDGAQACVREARAGGDRPASHLHEGLVRRRGRDPGTARVAAHHPRAASPGPRRDRVGTDRRLGGRRAGGVDPSVHRPERLSGARDHDSLRGRGAAHAPPDRSCRPHRRRHPGHRGGPGPAGCNRPLAAPRPDDQGPWIRRRLDDGLHLRHLLLGWCHRSDAEPRRGDRGRGRRRRAERRRRRWFRRAGGPLGGDPLAPRRARAAGSHQGGPDSVLQRVGLL